MVFSGKTWRPQLSGELRSHALETAREVGQRLRNSDRLRAAVRGAPQQSRWPEYRKWRPAHLAGGHAGLAMVFSQFAKVFPDEAWDLAAQAHGELALENKPRYIPPSLFQGAAGLAFIASEEPSPTDIPSLTPGAMVVGDFDVVSGLAGVGALLLQRESPLIERVVDEFVAVTEAGDPADVWHTPTHLLDERDRADHPHGFVNCGLAHGVPGPLALLSLAELHGIRVTGSRQAIEQLARWLSTARLGDGWPAVVAPGEPARARDGWCYGTPGVARSLWLAGEALDDSSYRDAAVAGMEAVYRRPIPDRRIDSPTFCHGVAGLLQITLRFATDTSLPLFQNAAGELVGQLIDQFEPDAPLGYRDLEADGRRVDQAGVLDGAAGVALVLLAASTETAPNWDRIFLLS